MCTIALERNGYEVVAVRGADQALEEAQNQVFDLVLTDIVLPGMRGNVLLEHLQKIQPELIAIIMTAFPSKELMIDSIRKGVYEFLTKPFDLNDLLAALRSALERREKEDQRAYRQFADSLLDREKNLGEEFDLHAAIAVLTGIALEKSAAPSASRSAIVILGEPLPADRALLKNSEAYRHLRTIYAAQRILNNQLLKGALPVELKLAIASNSADISRFLRLFSDQVCCAIFGPNFPQVSEGIVRLLALSGQDRHIVVCHNPERADFSWDQLVEFSRQMNIRGCRGAADDNETRTFWSHYFAQELRPLAEVRANGSQESTTTPAVGKIRELLATDRRTMELLPGFPLICQQVVRAIDEGKRYPAIAEIILPDGALQASIIHTANQARYGAQFHIETLPTALSIIGTEETKKIILGKAMNDLTRKIDQAGFNSRDFFRHCAGTGYAAQILSLDVETPSAREQEILQSFKLPQYLCDILTEFHYWSLFTPVSQFDNFTAGVLHDVGKVLNTVCYQDIFPLILHEIERGEWQDSLLDSEAAVVGEFQHPATGSALLEQWELFPHLVEPIFHHHHIHPDSPSEAVLIALANCLVKGVYPFPRAIAIPPPYRVLHLGPGEGGESPANPLPEAYQHLVNLFEMKKSRLALSPEEKKTGEYRPERAEALINAAREAIEQDAGTCLSALSAQNPEFPEVSRWCKTPAEDLLALGLLLKDTIAGMVDTLLQSALSGKAD